MDPTELAKLVVAIEHERAETSVAEPAIEILPDLFDTDSPVAESAYTPSPESTPPIQNVRRPVPTTNTNAPTFPINTDRGEKILVPPDIIPTIVPLPALNQPSQQRSPGDIQAPGIIGEVIAPPRRRRIAKGVSMILAATVALPIMADGIERIVAAPASPGVSNCTDKTHELVQVGGVPDGPFNVFPAPVVAEVRQLLDRLGVIGTNQRWDEVADYLSEVTGYKISPERLQAANPSAYALGSNVLAEQVQFNDDGDPSNEIATTGTFCYNIPPPVVAGQVEANGEMSLAAYSKQYGLTVDALRKLNPDVPASNDDPIGKGYVLWTTDQKGLNKDLVLRPLTEATPVAAAHDNYKLMSQITAANAARFGQGGTIQRGDLLYLPPIPGKQDKAKQITIKQIIQASKDAYTQDGRDDQPEPKLASPLPTPEASSPDPSVPGQKPAPSGGTKPESKPGSTIALTSYQEQVIAGLPNLSKQQRVNLAHFVAAIMQIQNQLDGIDPSVMLAQAILESSWGQSSLATKGYNFFGSKANGNWTGETMTVLTHEQIPGQEAQRAEYDAFRKYPSAAAGFQDYVDKIKNGPWYDDAREQSKLHPDDPMAYLKGLENELGHDGNIKIVRKMAYATDAHYEEKIMKLIDTYRLEDLIKGASIETEPVVPGSIKLNPKAYSANQRELPGNRSDGAWVVLASGNKVLSRTMTYNQRVEAVQNWLNMVKLSPEGYTDFMANHYHDLSSQVPQQYSNFDGHWPGMGGVPKLPDDIKFYVMHFTATNTSANDDDGMHMASSMQNGGRSIGVQNSTNNKGEGYHLTDYRTYHTRTWKVDGTVMHYNSIAVGNEIAACEQAAVNNLEYQAAIYMAVNFMTANGYISKDTPDAGAVVDSMLRGHRELNPTGHNDNPKLVMDQVRGLTKGLLVQMGYHVPSLQK